MYNSDDLNSLLIRVQKDFNSRTSTVMEQGIQKLMMDTLSKSLSHKALKFEINNCINENDNIGKSPELMEALYNLRIVLLGNLNKVPLFINAMKPHCIIAKWRLEIGK
jgi:hypothetical protein